MLVVQDLAEEHSQAEVNQLLNYLGLEKVSQFWVRHLWLGRRNTAPDEIVMEVDPMYRGDASLVLSLPSRGVKL